MFNKIIKLVIIVFVASAFCQCAYAQQEEVKIAYVDMAKIFDSYTKTAEQDEELSKKSEVKQQERDKMVERIRNMKEELDLLNVSQRELKQEQIDREIRSLQGFDRDAREMLRDERDTMVRNILREIDSIIKDYAAQNNYSMIFNDKILIYSEEKYDISEQIIKILNSRYKRSPYEKKR
ncbi:MAG: OmpH family outer membrane protein [Candidatus Omnitrophota bacterium]